MYSFEKIVGSDGLRASVIKALAYKYNQTFCEDDVDDILSMVNLRLLKHGDFEHEKVASRWTSLAIQSCIVDWIRHKAGRLHRNARYEDMSFSGTVKIHGNKLITPEDTLSYSQTLVSEFGEFDFDKSTVARNYMAVDPMSELDMKIALVQVLEMAKRDLGSPYHAMIDRVIFDINENNSPRLTAEGGSDTEKTRAYRIRKYLREHMVQGDWM